MPKSAKIITVALLTSLVVLAGAFLIFWFNRDTKTTPPSFVPPASDLPAINSFQACADAGNPVRESYPEVCATPDGQSFSNPSQSL